VLITHAGGAPIVADPCTVMFYNRAQQYRRDALSGDGDLCEWFAFDESVVVEALRTLDPGVESRADRPFSLTHGPSDAAGYARQRAVTAALVLLRPCHGSRVPTAWRIDQDTGAPSG